MPDRRAQRPVERAEGVGGDAAEQRPRLRRCCHAPREQRRRRRRREAEAGEPQRVARHVQDRPRGPRRAGRRSGRRAARTAARQAAPSAPSPAAVSSIERTITAGPAVVERVGEVDLGPAPLEPVALELERARGTASRPPSGGPPSSRRGAGRARSARRCGCRRRSVGRPRAPSRDARRASATARGEPVRAGADDDRVDHQRAERCRCVAASLFIAALDPRHPAPGQRNAPSGARGRSRFSRRWRP